MICAISIAAVVRFTEPASVVLRVTWRATILIFTFLVSWTLPALAYLHYAVGGDDRSRLLLYRFGHLMNSSHGIGRRLSTFCCGGGEAINDVWFRLGLFSQYCVSLSLLLKLLPELIALFLLLVSEDILLPSGRQSHTDCIFPRLELFHYGTDHHP